MIEKISNYRTQLIMLEFTEPKVFYNSFFPTTKTAKLVKIKYTTKHVQITTVLFSRQNQGRLEVPANLNVT